MQAKLISADSQKNFEDLVSVSLPAPSGEMEILENHAEIFAVLKGGTVLFKSKNASNEEDIPSGAICHLKDNSLSVIV